MIRMGTSYHHRYHQNASNTNYSSPFKGYTINAHLKPGQGQKDAAVIQAARGVFPNHPVRDQPQKSNRK